MDLQNLTKKYTTDELTIVWKPGLCIHSKICWKGLPEVFKPQEKPWIQPEGTDSERIKNQINACPSGALSCIKNSEEPPAENPATSVNKVEVLPNGPLLVHGEIVVNCYGEETNKSNVTAFCRCGASANKPYCDGSHSKSGFEG